MITAADLRKLARARLTDSLALLKEKRYDGAVYLGGYVVELALKARICRTLRWAGFPETRQEFQSLASFRTHKLDILLALSGQEQKVKTGYLAEWSAVATWTRRFGINYLGQLAGLMPNRSRKQPQFC